MFLEALLEAERHQIDVVRHLLVDCLARDRSLQVALSAILSSSDLTALPTRTTAYAHSKCNELPSDELPYSIFFYITVSMAEWLRAWDTLVTRKLWRRGVVSSVPNRGGGGGGGRGEGGGGGGGNWYGFVIWTWLSFKILNLFGILSSWGSSNHRRSAPFLYEVASRVKNRHFSDYYYYYYYYCFCFFSILCRLPYAGLSLDIWCAPNVCVVQHHRPRTTHP